MNTLESSQNNSDSRKTVFSDENGRPVIVVKENGSLIFVRYKDMSDDCKLYLKEVLKKITTESGAPVDISGNEIREIDDFLNFKEQADICG